MNLKVTVISSLVFAFAPAVSAADAPSYNDLFTSGSSILIAENRGGTSNDMRGRGSKSMQNDSMAVAYESNEMESNMMEEEHTKRRIHHKRD